VPDGGEAETPASPSGPRRSSTVNKVTCAAGAVAALVGLGYMLLGSLAVVDFVLLVGGLLLALVGLVRLLRRNPAA
jgi:hypothetical protein